jgi:hypothetical protein
VRQAESKPLMDDLKRRLTALLEGLSMKSTLAKAIRYTLGHWHGLTIFLSDGRVCRATAKLAGQRHVGWPVWPASEWV